MYDLLEGEIDEQFYVPFNMYIGGSYFGDSDVLNDETRDGTALVDAESNLFAISKKDIKEVLAYFDKHWIKREMLKVASERRQYHKESIEELKLANHHIKKKKIKEFKQKKGLFGPQMAPITASGSPPTKRKTTVKKDKIALESDNSNDKGSSSDENKEEDFDLKQLRASGIQEDSQEIVDEEAEDNDDFESSSSDFDDSPMQQKKRKSNVKKSKMIAVQRLNTIQTNFGVQAKAQVSSRDA